MDPMPSLTIYSEYLSLIICEKSAKLKKQPWFI
jgi:hypothetical protein